MLCCLSGWLVGSPLTLFVLEHSVRATGLLSALGSWSAMPGMPSPLAAAMVVPWTGTSPLLTS